MADDLKHSTTISKKDKSFRDYLDFEKLRSEGIEYLGKLAGQIWTDHNVHDPGITILEMLCYALLDLGYRTNLPLEDILTRNPEGTSPDNNFFTPAKILANNPITVTDFRKLLIDLKEVQNAWLEPATDITDICRPNEQNPSDNDIQEGNNSPCTSFLNGLYHVYLDLEKNIDNCGDIHSDFLTEADVKKYKNEVLNRVKKALMAHRNFCEDFADIYILCKLPMGVCAEIELEENAKSDEVYMKVVEELRDFFTPAPRFYTLQELLDKQKSIEEIFAGRPYNITQSHGFVDTEEFEALKLKKEIHTSDVYNVLFKVPGVCTVHNLSLRTCDGTFETTGWKFQIKENHIPEFSTRCSGFRFTRNGMPISVDVEKYQRLFDLNFSNSGKVLYQTPSPYLDSDIPKGSYHSELADYYSIQNEFPRVYAIQEGGLADKAPNKRKAQALQLKGYLLFFDQLLANYLTQLGNIRSLFALDSPKDEKEQHTYFINQLTSVPELQKLLRFPSTENGGNGSSVSNGDTLVFPMDKNKLLALKESDQLKYFDLEQEPSFVFSSQAEKDIEVSQLKADLKNEVYDCEIITKTDNCVYYYILSSSENIALVSKKYFKNTDLAQEDAASVKYIGVFDENYRSFVDSKHQFSFTIDMNLASFAEYLQLLVENRDLYLERRQGFLQHLLARFAETFTDYALLTFGNASNEKIEESKIEATEKFLINYDDISSNRGKAFDYRVNGWNNDNISGFEKRVKSLSGMEHWKRRSLCNFEVNRYDEQYAAILNIEDRDLFTLSDTYDSREEAQQAIRSFFSALSDRKRYSVQPVPYEQTYAISLREGDRILADYHKRFDTVEEAHIATKHLQRLFSGNCASSKNTFASDFIYHLQLKDYKGEVVETSSQSYDSEAIAKSVLVQIKQGINDDRWQTDNEPAAPAGTLFRIPHRKKKPHFIDLDAFRIDIDDMLAGKTDKFGYYLLDIRDRFKFRALEEFDSLKQSREHWRQLLSWMWNAGNYRIQPERNSDSYSLHIVVDDEDRAACSEYFANEKQAGQAMMEILSIVRQNVYTLAIKKVPDRWKFSFRLGIEQADPFSFESLDEYETREEAFDAAIGFQKSIPTLQVRKYKDEGEFRLVPIKPPEETSSVRLTQTFEDEDEESLRVALNKEVSLQQEVNRILEEPPAEAFAASVALDELSEQGLYVYRLIDKDIIPACYSESFAERSSAVESMKTLRKIDCEGYSALEICLGGRNVINKRIEENTGVARYHYLIRSRNRFGESGKELILFESTQGYVTEEEAQIAFAENYLQILEWASHAENYETIISPEEKLIHQPVDYSDDEAIVFIPQAIWDEWGEETKSKLVSLAKSYPIRVVDRNSDRFYALFPCEVKPEKREERICEPAEEIPVYYFQLKGADSEEESSHSWQSTDYFDTQEEARRGYRFFRMLLCYPGNFFVRCDPCDKESGRYQICLREVLAESTARFSSEAEAWGKEGVQKFICVSQSERAFHPYWNKRDECCSFYLACADGVIYHPCHYDTPQKRDQAIETLSREVHEQQKTRAWQFAENQEEETHLLLNEAGDPFATVSFGDQYVGCEGWVIFFSNTLRNQIKYESDENGTFSAFDEESRITVYAYENVEEAAWKKTLRAFACYYPIVKRLDEKTGKYVYCVEIKLPGFSYCSEDPDEDKPCGCNGKEEQTKPDCYIAWKSRCCFTGCDEALRAWEAAMKLLLQHKNYRPLFDCDCYDFSIALHYNNLEGSGEIVSPGSGLPLGASEMVALNPQCYANPDEVCAAIERSWKLINAEGLHVAEHILLRPRCDEACECEWYGVDCENETGCKFEWSEPDEDPCADEPAACFEPGADPYSFIATVALPAWPARFRKPENRRLLEQILYREAPAHVLLRILWLAPHDFCCFESKYQKWGRWLAQKETCLEDFSVCDFLEFLFNRNYECLQACDVCEPCKDNETKTDFCAEYWSEESMDDPYAYLNQINDLYCWTEQDCEGYQFTPCKRDIIIEDGDEDDDVVLLSHRSAEERNDETGVAEAETEPEETTESTVQPLIPKPQMVNSRMARYRAVVDRELEESNQHALAAKAKAFVTDPLPSPERTSNLLIEIAESKKPAEGKAMTEKQVVNLLQNVLCYYLDKVCFNGGDSKKIEALRPALEAIGEAEIDIDLEPLYGYWKPEEVRLYEPETDFKAIRRMISGEEDN
jgi:hypothetical protein